MGGIDTASNSIFDNWIPVVKVLFGLLAGTAAFVAITAVLM